MLEAPYIYTVYSIYYIFILYTRCYITYTINLMIAYLTDNGCWLH